MSRKVPAAALFTIVALAAGAAGILVAGSDGATRSPQAAEEFQRLVGGLGFGPALDLAPCAADFDPRLGGSRLTGDALIPGAGDWCPQAALSIFHVRPPEGRDETAPGDPDAASP